MNVRLRVLEAYNKCTREIISLSYYYCYYCLHTCDLLCWSCAADTDAWAEFIELDKSCKE